MSYQRKTRQGKAIASTIYLPQATDKKYKAKAKAGGKSKSKVLVETLVENEP